MRCQPAYSRRILLLALLGVSVGVGCQEQVAGPLAPPGLNAQDQSAARVNLFDACVDFSDPDKHIRQMLDAVNAERATHHVPPLKLDQTLMQIADFYACRLVDGRFFAHVDPNDGSSVDTRAADFGYAFQKIGENLAAGQRSAKQALADWMKSPDHRANILDPVFTEIGIAVKAGGEMSPVWAQEFGRPIAADAATPQGRTSPSGEQPPNLRQSATQPTGS